MEWNLCFPSALTGLGSNCYLLHCDFHLGEKHSLFFSYTALPQTFLLPGWYASSSSFCPGANPVFFLKPTLCCSQAHSLLSHLYAFPHALVGMPFSSFLWECFLPPSPSQQMLPSSFTKPFQNALIKNPCLISLRTFFPKPCNDLFRFPEDNN